jgi:ATP-binding protein involved in chromosome partitioning
MSESGTQSGAPNEPADGPSADARIAAILPRAVGERVRSLRLADGIVTLVLDVAGLEPAARAPLEAGVRAALAAEPGVAEVRIAMVADRPARRRILAVASGKGGVGKSTLAANLAIALARSGLRVGLVDADIHGPSQPRLLGSEHERPVAHDGKLVPVAGKWGVPLLSMGHLVAPETAIAWRGPKVAGALTRLIDAHWEAAELLVVDLPPGTGDVQLTMIQRFKPDGAVIVSTPQDLALIDATRAITLFREAQVPIVGLVENMAGYACPHCGEISDPFGSGGAEAQGAALGLAFLGRIPLALSIRRDSDAGTPPAAGTGPDAQAFAGLAVAVRQWLDGRPG